MTHYDAYSPAGALFLAENVVFDYSKIPTPDTRPGELEFLAGYDPKKYDETASKTETLVYTADAVIFTVTDNVLKVLLIQRGGHPFKGFWCLPGGFVNAGENPDYSVTRELEEETGLVDVTPRFVGVASHPWRDPRMKFVTSYVYSLVIESEATVSGMDDAVDAGWVPVTDVLAGIIPVGFDHYRSIQKAVIQEFTS